MLRLAWCLLLCLVYTPTATLNQSSVVVMFQSGACVEVVENNRHMSARVYLPITFMVSITKRKLYAIFHCGIVTNILQILVKI